MNKDTLNELLDRVKAATGPDRELDADICLALLGGEVQWRQANYTMEMYPVARRPSTNHIGGYEHEQVPVYTASIDAALALVERCLPGWMVVNLCEWEADVLRERGPWNCALKKFGTQDDFTAAKGVCHHATTAPLAILSALLQSLSTQSNNTQEEC